MDKTIVFRVDGIHFTEWAEADAHCSMNRLDPADIEKVHLPEGRQILDGKIVGGEGGVTYKVAAILFPERDEAVAHCKICNIPTTSIETIELGKFQQVIDGEIVVVSATFGDLTKAYTVMGKYYATFKEAEDDAYGEIVHTIELAPGQSVFENRLISGREIEYKVTWNTQEIPFWQNFEGAKACVLAINTNKNGNKARLVSFMPEKEVRL